MAAGRTQAETATTAATAATAMRAAATEVASGSRVARALRAIGSERVTLALCVLALVVRLWGINFGLPYAAHPDEPVVNGTVVQMLHDGHANPATFIYPSALYYILAVVGLLYQLVTHTTIGFPPGETGLGLYPTPEYVLWTRICVALLGVAAVAVVYRTARDVVGKWPALGAGLLLALSPLAINLSQIATTDGPAATGLVLVAACCVLAARTGSTRAFWFAGAALGLATGLKYNAVAGGTMLACAYGIVLWRQYHAEGRLAWRERVRDKRLLGFVLVPVVFLVTTPFALVHPGEFARDVAGVVLHYGVNGHVGNVGSSFTFTLGEMFANFEWLLSGLACVGVVSALVRRRPETFVVVVGAVVYFLVVATPKVHFERNLAPLWPLLALLAAEGIMYLAVLGQAAARRLPQLRGARGRAAVVCALLVLIAVGLVPVLQRMVQLDSVRASTDVRATASAWINANLPPGATVAIESYSVTLDTQRFAVTYLRDGLYTKPMSWYPAHGIQYVVASYIFYYRFFVNGNAYPTERGDYNAMLSQWQVVRVFTGANTTGGSLDGKITVLRVPASFAHSAHSIPSSVARGNGADPSATMAAMTPAAWPGLPREAPSVRTINRSPLLTSRSFLFLTAAHAAAAATAGSGDGGHARYGANTSRREYQRGSKPAVIRYLGQSSYITGSLR